MCENWTFLSLIKFTQEHTLNNQIKQEFVYHLKTILKGFLLQHSFGKKLNSN